MKQFIRNLSIAVGVVLVWRGVWYLLDAFDRWLFEGNHIPMAVVGIVLGILILYIPDKDIKELGKL